ncbi:MAG: hypothetical protein ACYC27_22530 [Armatimonadota bacterium]
MTGNYSPKVFLRHVPLRLLREYLEKKDIHLSEEWDLLRAGIVDPMYNALWSQDSTLLTSIESDFRSIHSMANLTGVHEIIEEAESTRPELGLAQTIGEMNDQYEASFWTFVNHPEIFEIARILDYVNSGSFSKLSNLPEMIELPNDMINKQFLDSLSAYYQQSEGRGSDCHIDYYQRGSRHYWFAFLSDYPQAIHIYDDHKLKVESQRLAFDIVFVYDEMNCTLDISAGRAKKRVPDLQKIFTRAVLGFDIELTNSKELAYQLNGLLSRDFQFPTDIEDDIDCVKVKMLKCGILGLEGRTIILNVAGKGGLHAIYDLLDGIILSNSFTKDILTIKQATIQVTFKPEAGLRRRRTRTFTVSCPNSCSLKFEPKDIIIRKYLKKWGLDVSKRSTDTAEMPGINAQRVIYSK